MQNYIDERDAILTEDNLMVHFSFDKDLKDKCHKLKCEIINHDDNKMPEIVDTTNIEDLNNYNFKKALWIDLNNSGLSLESLRSKYDMFAMYKPLIFAVDFYYYLTDFISFSSIFEFACNYDRHDYFFNKDSDYSNYRAIITNKRNIIIGNQYSHINIKAEINRWNHFQWIFTNFDDPQFLFYYNDKYIVFSYHADPSFEESYLCDFKIGDEVFAHKDFTKSGKIYKLDKSICFIRDFKIYYKPEESLKDKIKRSLPFLFPKS